MVVTGFDTQFALSKACSPGRLSMARSLESLQSQLRAHQDRSPDAAKLAAAGAGLPAKAAPKLRSVIKGHERKVCACVLGPG